MKKFENLFIIFSLLITCICITFISSSLSDNLIIDNKIIEVNLNGEDNIDVIVNSEYIDDGVSVTVDGIILDDIDYTSTNNINLNRVGEYQVDYKINYENQEYNLKRIVNVIDNIKPQIYIFNISVSIKGDNNNLRYYAFDNYDGDLTDKVSVTIEDNNYKLRVVDSSLNEVIEYIPISNTLEDIVMEINGTHLTYVKKDSIYEDMGVNFTNIDGKELNINYNVEGNVDTSVVGEYILKYTSDETNFYQIRKVIVYDTVESNINTCSEEKTIYLTFDDGPGAYTEELLNILDKYNVKATFFVTGQFKKYIYLIGEERTRGHAVGVHTYSHEWKIYRSFENYYDDFNTINNIIKEQTGEYATIFRFPGGGSNTISKSKSRGIMSYATNKMTELGYTYFDWNVDSEDAAGASSKNIYKNVINGIESRNCSVVLMHDIKKNTVSVIEDVIVYALDNGYTFKTLSSDSVTVHHHVNN